MASFCNWQPAAARSSVADRVLLAVFATVCGVAVSAMALRAPQPGQLAVLIYPPWTSGSEAITRAAETGARVVGLGRYPFTVVVMPSVAEPLHVLSRRTALLIAAPSALGCFASGVSGSA